MLSFSVVQLRKKTVALETSNGVVCVEDLLVMSKQIFKQNRLMSLQISYILEHYVVLRFYSLLGEYSGNIWK